MKTHIQRIPPKQDHLKNAIVKYARNTDLQRQKDNIIYDQDANAQTVKNGANNAGTYII